MVAVTSQTLLYRLPSWRGSRTHTIPVALATSTAATLSNTRCCSSSSITCGLALPTAVTSLSWIWVDRRAARGPAVMASDAGILTVVLEATESDPQVAGPGARRSGLARKFVGGP